MLSILKVSWDDVCMVYCSLITICAAGNVVGGNVGDGLSSLAGHCFTDDPLLSENREGGWLVNFYGLVGWVCANDNFCIS